MRRRILPLLVALFAAVALAACSQTHAATTTTKAPAAQKPAVATNVVSPPASINQTCASDDTKALAKWLYSLPRTGEVVDLSGGCFLVNGSMFLRDFRNFTLENGTIKETAALVGDTFDTLPNGAAYCGNRGFTKASDTDFLADPGTEPIVEPVVFEGGCHITVKDMTFRGPNKGTAGGPTEQDTFISFDGTQYAEVTDTKMSDPYGDCVDAQSLHEASGGVGYEYPATNVTVTDSTCSGTGRQGLSIILANHVTFSDDTLSGVPDAVFDVEVDAVGGYQDDLDILHNTINDTHSAAVLSAQTGSAIDRLQFSNNTITGEMTVLIHPALASENIRIDSNTATEESSSANFSRPGVWIWGPVDAKTTEIDDNAFPLNRQGVDWSPRGVTVCQNVAKGLRYVYCPVSPVQGPAVAALP
jgi:hypothetical protein